MRRNSMPADPLGHVQLSVSSFKASRRFYALLFKELGVAMVADKEKSAGWVTREGFGIWIRQAVTSGPKQIFSAPGLHHICVKADSRSGVGRIYERLKRRITVSESPRRYPQHTKDYYAVCFADPDGMQIEVAYY